MQHAANLDKRKVSRSFGRAAVHYDGYAALQHQIGNRLLDRLSDRRHACTTTLDVGAGTGYCTRRLSQQPDGSVIALDLAVPMLQHARRNLPGTVTYLCADAESLPLGDASIDLIFSNLAIQWCPDLDALFTGFRRVLKPEGLVLFSSFGTETLSELRRAWAQVDQNSHVNRFYHPHTLKAAMRSAGFAGAHVTSELLKVGYSSVFELMQELKGIGAHNCLQGRPRGLTGRHRLHSMIQAYEGMMEQGIVTASFEVLYGSAVSSNAI